MHEIEWTDDKVTRIWNYYAKNPAYQNQYFSYHSGKNIIEYVNKYIKLKNINTFLDFGCGPGYLIEHLLKFLGNKWEGRIYALDFSKEAIDRMNQKFKVYKNIIYPIYINKLPSSIEADSIDCIFSIEVIEHLNDKHLSEMINEIYRILKPGGYLVITTPNNEDLEANRTICPECGCIFHRWQHVRSWDSKNIMNVLLKYNFTDIRIKEVTIYPETSSRKIINFFKRIVKTLIIEKNNPNPNTIIAIVRK